MGAKNMLNKLVLLSFFLSLPFGIIAQEIDVDELLQLTEEQTLNAGWERRRRMQLVMEGHEATDVQRIIVNEKSRLNNQHVTGVSERLSAYLARKSFENVSTMETILSPLLKNIAESSTGNEYEMFNKGIEQVALEELSNREGYSDQNERLLFYMSKTWKQWLFLNEANKTAALIPLLASMKKEIVGLEAARKELEAKKKKFAGLKSKIDILLADKKLSKIDYSYVFNIEFGIQLQVAELSSEAREKKYHDLHVQEAVQFINQNHVLPASYKKELDQLAQQWDSFFFYGEQQRAARANVITQSWAEDKLSDIKKQWSTTLKKNGLAGEDYANLLKIEMSIQKKVLEVPLGRRESVNLALHVAEAKRLVRDSSVLDIYTGLKNRDVFVKAISSNWQDWFYFSAAEKYSKMSLVRDKVEFDFFVNGLLKELKKNNLEELNPLFESFKKDTVVGIEKYNELKARASRDYGNKLTEVIQSKLKEARNSGKEEALKELLQIQYFFEFTGECPPTDIKKIRNIKNAYEEKVMKQYLSFVGKYQSKTKKVNAKLIADIRKETSSKGDAKKAKALKKIHKTFQEAAKNYSEMGNKFEADLYVSCAVPYEIRCDNEIVASSTSKSSTVTKSKVTIRLGQRLCVKAPAIRGDEPGFSCLIQLNRKIGLPSHSFVWQSYTSNKKSEWAERKGMKKFENSVVSKKYEGFYQNGFNCESLTIPVHKSRYEGYLTCVISPGYLVWTEDHKEAAENE